MAAMANNPWLLELPDPITKATWDNYVMSLARNSVRKLLGIDISKTKRCRMNTKCIPTKPSVSVKAGNKEIALPALIVPGMNDNTIAIAVGYGRASAGNDETATARKYWTCRRMVQVKMLAGFAIFNGVTVDMYNCRRCRISKAEGTYKVAQNQTHNSYEGRHEVVKEITL